MIDTKEPDVVWKILFLNSFTEVLVPIWKLNPFLEYWMRISKIGYCFGKKNYLPPFS